jgi:nitrous oxidase accessory protein
MKMISYIMFFFLLVFSMPTVSEADTTLQAKIDRASKGDTIEIEAGEYEETINIAKPITLEGKGEVLLRSCEEQPVITISGELVTLKNIKVEHCGDQNLDKAIYVTGSNHILEDMTIETRRMGIVLDGANDVTIQDSKITGRRQGNGIDLWRSNRNHFENLMISNVFDGLYIEQSNENTLHKNKIEKSRYGMHLMFSNDNVLSENVSRSNVTGTMLMESKRTTIRDNAFYANRNSVNAQGLLLYLTTETEVTGNEFISNRVGIYIEEAENNTIQSNKILDNFIGVQFEKAVGNQIKGNTFVGNVNDAQAIESSNNEINGNYWDAASKVDVDGNGKSEIVFTADPYFQTLTSDVPEFQLFFQAPGLILLQNMLKSPPEKLLTDSTPLMDMTMVVEKEASSGFSLWVMCAVMILVSSSLFILGRKRG